MWIAAPLPIPGMAGPTWGAEHGLPDCESPPRGPASEISRFVEPGPSEPPLHGLCLRPPQFHLPLTPQASFSFLPQQAHHLIFIKHAELMLHKSPQRGLT